MGESSQSPAPRLEVRGLGVFRGPVRLLNDVSFALSPGQLLALRGSNGSGKTTLLRCVAGLTRADSGEVFWDGQPAREGHEFRAQVLYSGHSAGLKEDLNALENLEFLLRLRGVGVPQAQLEGAVQAVGLSKRRLLPARRLSAGQRRRIGLARLALDPAACWILDEPLTALDVEGAAILGRSVEAHLARGGVALVATHHDLPVAGMGVREMALS